MRLRALAALTAAVLLASTSPIAVGARIGAGPHAPAQGYLRLVRLIEAGDIGLRSPRGLAYTPEASSLIITGAAADGSAVLRSITLLEKPLGEQALPAGLPASPNVAYDAAHDQLVGAASTGAVVTVPTPGGLLKIGATASSAPVQGGSASDLATGLASNAMGESLVLDASGRISVVSRAAGAPRVARGLSLSAAGEALRGLAVAPDGHLFSIGAASRTLYEFDAAGTLLVKRNLNELNVRSPQGLVVAPTADTNDASSLTSLYLADAGTPAGTGAGIMEIAFSEPVLSAATATAAQPTVTLVKTTNTGSGSALNPDSPDPSGLAYIPASETEVPASRRDRLVIADGEVEETTGAGFHNVNVWFAPTNIGLQSATFNTTVSPTNPVNKEPVGAAYDPATNELYIAKDGSNGRIWVYNAVNMSQLRSFDVTVAPYNDADTEGLAFGNGILYMVDAIDNDLVKVLPGPNGVVGTGGDDIVTNYDLEQYGQTEPEGLDVHPDTGNIWVVSNRLSPTNGPDPMIEVTPTGQLVSTVSIAAANPNSAAGLAIAPPSAGGAGWNIYVSDRMLDNSQDPNENDGRIYEFSVGGGTGAPETTIDSGPSGTVSSPDATFTFSGSAGTTSFECRLDSADPNAFSACTSPKAYTALADGPHTFEVRALAGTTADPTPASRTWTINTQTSAPETTIDSGPSGTVSSPDATFTFSGSAGTTSFECRLDSAGWAACTSPKAYTGLADGPHTFEVRALAGTTADPTPASRTWTINTQTSGNLLSNPGFELDANGDTIPDNWGTKTKFTRSSAIPPHGGTYEGRHFATNNSGYSIFQQVTVTAGTNYTFNGYVNVPATVDAFTFQVKIKWMNGSTVLKTTKVAPVTSSTAGWQLMSVSTPAPSGATSAQVMMTVSSLNGAIYVDDFSLAAGP